MKVAVFSDVQGNIAALETVVEDIDRWQPDLVIMNGDLINRGPRNPECLALFSNRIQGDGWLPIRGNHEDFLLYCLDNPPHDPIDAQMRRFADWTIQQLGDSLQPLRNWPDHLIFSAPASDAWVHVTHGTLAGNRDGISTQVSDAQLRGKLPDAVDLFITAHTHKVHQRTREGLHILNIGSVGSPFDGDVRAAYARIRFTGDQWRLEIRRLDYDRKRAAADFIDSGFLDNAGPLARIIVREWELARSLFAHWNREYRQAVLAGEISLEYSVDCFLQSID